MDWKLIRALMAQTAPPYFMRATSPDGRQRQEFAGDLEHAAAWGRRQITRHPETISVGIFGNGDWVGSLLAPPASHTDVALTAVGFGNPGAEPPLHVAAYAQGPRPVAVRLADSRDAARVAAREMLETLRVVTSVEVLPPSSALRRDTREWQRERLETVSRAPGGGVTVYNHALLRAETEARVSRQRFERSLTRLQREQRASDRPGAALEG